MKKLSLVILSLLATAGVANAAQSGLSHANGAPGIRGHAHPLGAGSISQMTDNTPVTGSGVSCNNGTATLANSWWRRFYFDEHGGPASAAIQSVTVSTEEGPTTPIIVNLYTIPATVAVDTISLADLTLIGTGTADSAGALTSVDVPAAGTVADAVANDLVVEYHIDSSDGPYFEGANGTTETHPSFLSSADCGITDPATVGDVGFADSHLAMVVNLGSVGPGAPSVTKAFAPASVVAGADSTLTITLNNSTQPGAATLDAPLTDTFPSGLVVSATPAASTTCGGTLTADAGAASVSLASGGTIPASGTCTITVSVSAAVGGSYANTIPAGALSTDLGDNANAANATLLVFTGGPGTFPPDENFDENPAPLLPTGWISSGTNDWATDDSVSDTAPNSAHAGELPTVSDFTLDSPSFTPVAAQTVSFRHSYNLEDTFDGAVVEISTDGGTTFTDIIDAGGSFVSGGYDGPISANFASPIAGRDAWTGSSGGFITTVINLPASSVGLATVLRFRTADDSSATASGAVGWWVDTIHLDVGTAPTDPVIAVTPASLAFSVAANATDTDTLTIGNTGGGTLTFSISEAAGAARAKPTSYRTSRAMMQSKAIVNGLQARPTGTLIRSNLAGSNRPHPKSSVLGSTEISQMDDNTPGDEGVACGASGASIADNSWWRRFYFSEYPTVGATTGVNSVKISSGSTGVAGLPFTINLYTTPHSTAVDTIDTTALTLIGTATGTIDSGLQEVTVPVTGTVSDTAGTDLVVEWHTDGSDTNSFYPGANATPETHPTFLSSETCGLSEPATADSIGFPDFHLTMVVGLGDGGPATGCSAPSDVPWLSVAPATGSVAAGQTTTSTVTVDTTGLTAGAYSANLCVTSNDPVTPLVTVPVALTVTVNDVIFKDGFDGSGGGGEPGTFTDRTAFVGAIAAGYYENAFDDAVPGPSDDLTYTQGGISYTVAASSSTADGGGLYNDTGIISTNLATDSIVITFTGDPVTAVGGNVWATDISVQPTGTDITVTLSDGTTNTFTSTGPTDFLGFTTAAAITTMTIDAPDGADATPYWATLDNLIVGSAN